VKDPASRRYHLAPLIYRLTSNPTIGHHHLILHSRKELKYLRDLSGETTGLQIQMGYYRMTFIISKKLSRISTLDKNEEQRQAKA
jgi:hypothetical protein